MRIGIFGGTFNPPHLGHRHIVEDFHEQMAAAGLPLDKILIIPTYVPPHKAAPDLASGEDRLLIPERPDHIRVVFYCFACFLSDLPQPVEILVLRQSLKRTPFFDRHSAGITFLYQFHPFPDPDLVSYFVKCHVLSLL